MNKLYYRSIVVLLLAAMFAAFATPVLADAPAPDKQTAKYEIKFMEDMIDHHAMAVAQAALVGVSVGAVLVLIAVLLVAVRQVAGQRNRALEQERITRTNRYAADISLAQRLLDEGDLLQARRVLAEHWPKPSTLNAQHSTDLRGFEWRHFWKRCEGNALATLRGHTGAVTCLAFAPAGVRLFSGSRDGTVKLWDVGARRCLETLPLPEPFTATGLRKEVVSLALSPDGRRLAVVIFQRTLQCS